jgi:hypothetical protein
MQNIFSGKSSRIVTVLFLFLMIFNSCKKADTVGLEVLPEEDRLQGEYTDTITIIAHTVLEDSLLTSGTTFHILGSHNDPIFGLTTASIYSQFVLESVDPDFGTSPTLDSVVLSLAYAGHYSDIMKLGGEQSFSVHRVTQDISDSLYSDDTREYHKISLGTYSGLVDTRDSVMINGTNQPPQMRIKLNNSFGNELLNSASLMSSDSLFLEAFKGLYITPSTQNLLSGMGSLLYISPSSAYSKMTLYYHNTDTTALQEFDFIIKSSTERFTSFKHDYSTAFDITDQLADSTLGADKLYLQAMAGLKTKITFPHLNNLVANGREIAINKAELIFPVTAGTTSRLSPPSRLILVKKGTDGKDKFLDDAIYESGDFFGGYYNSPDKEFKLNIPRHIQSLLKDTASDKTIYLRVTGAAASANRCVLNGTGNADKPLKLRLTYTILE